MFQNSTSGSTAMADKTNIK